MKRKEFKRYFDDDKSCSSKKKHYMKTEEIDEENSPNKSAQFMSTSKNNTSHESNREKKLNDLVSYYKNILETLKTLSDEDKEIFVTNALYESKGYEIELSCNTYSSHCFEMLLSICKDSKVLFQFMTAFADDKISAFTNPSCSHITELLLKIAVQNIKNWANVFESEEMSEEKEVVNFTIKWITELNDFVIQNLESCLQQISSCHVVNSIICALGGYMITATETMSKRSKHCKQQFQQKYLDDQKFQVIPSELDAIPKIFKSSLKLLLKSILKVENICDYAVVSSSSTVLETLLCILKKRAPKYCKKFVSGLTSKLLEEKDDKGIPYVYLDKVGSFVVEKIFCAADEQVQSQLWEEHFSQNLDSLIIHPIGNVLLNKVVDIIESTELFITMTENIEGVFSQALSCHHYGIFLSLARTCNRLKSQNAWFMKSLMTCLQCYEPEIRQAHLVSCILALRPFQQHQEFSVCLQGSLLVQALLKFQKPIKIVLSMLNLKAQELSYLACHIQGCHVLNAFFNSTTVGDKNKDKLVHGLKPSLVQISCDKNGSLTLCRLWMLMSLKQQTIVAQTLCQEQSVLQNDRNGFNIYNKFGLFHFTRNIDKWKEFQKNVANKKSTTKE